MKFSSHPNTSRLFFFIAVSVLIVGCDSGPNTATVTGVITLDGKPTADIVVQFSPTQGGRPAIGVTDAQGQYKLRFTQNQDGCIPGSNLTQFTANAVPGNDLTQFLPKRYNEEARENPDMVVEVKKGKNTLNFNILSE